MSRESAARVVEIKKLAHHPNADKLDISQIDGNYPCIFQRDTFKPGDRAVYIPVDSVVPDTASFAFLEGHTRIKARRLRGIFSMGLLMPLSEFGLPADIEPGTFVSEQLGITKYEPPVNTEYWKTGDIAKDPGVAPVFEVEGMRMYPDLFKDGDLVHITEKIHGTNFRAVFHDGELHVGSHRTWLKKGPNLWWNVAQNANLEDKLRAHEDVVLYGEIYGPKVQDLTYGVKTPQLIFYDVMLGDTQIFFPAEQSEELIHAMGLQFVPVLWEDSWEEECKSLASGSSVLALWNKTEQIKEGIVIRPQREKFSPELGGRLILKLCGEQYYLRKEK